VKASSLNRLFLRRAATCAPGNTQPTRKGHDGMSEYPNFVDTPAIGFFFVVFLVWIMWANLSGK
jgi:hypothetical protein